MKKLNLFHLAWPIFIETAMFILLGFIDVYILSSYDDLAASSVNTATQTISIVTIVFQILSTAGAVMISQYLGAGKRKDASLVSVLLITSQLFFGVIISVIFLLFNRPVLMLIGADGQILEYASGYLTIVGGTMMFQALMNACAVIIRNHGMTKLPMFVTAGMNVLNTGLDLLTVPTMGVTGAAIATAISRIICSIVLVIILFKKIESPSAFKLLKPFPRGEFLSMLKIGVPSAMETFLYNLSQLLITSIVLYCLSENELITKTYVQIITTFFYLFAMAIGQASQIMIGHLVGAQRYDEAYRQGFRSYRTAIIITVVTCTIGIFLRKPLLSVFTDNAEVIAIGCTILLMNAVLEFGRTTNIVIIACMRGAGDVYFPTACAVLSNWIISVGCSYLLAVVCGMGIYGLWIALAADECVRGILMIIRWKSGAWRAKRVVKESDGEESTTNQFVLANEKGAVALSPQKEKDRVA